MREFIDSISLSVLMFVVFFVIIFFSVKNMSVFTKEEFVDEVDPVVYLFAPCINEVKVLELEELVKKLEASLAHQTEQKVHALEISGPRLNRIRELELEVGELNNKIKYGTWRHE